MARKVVFRFIDGESVNICVAHLIIDQIGQRWAVPTNEDVQKDPRLATQLELDPTLLVERFDDVSTEPYYLYRGVLSIPGTKPQKPQ